MFKNINLFYLTLFALILTVVLSCPIPEQNTYFINCNVEPNSAGIINLNPDKELYTESDVVELTVIANELYEFLNWEGDLTGNSNPAFIRMDSDKNITAIFVALTPEPTPEPTPDPTPIPTPELPVNLPKTGQTISYGTGDDGTLQMGVEWPNPRFTDNNDNTITDNLTGLMWEKIPPTTSGTWQEALEYCNELTLAEYTDWRLPNVNEIASLMHEGATQSSYWLNAQGFIGIQASMYWSSTTFASNTDHVWTVDMNEGFVCYYSLKGSSYYILAVR